MSTAAVRALRMVSFGDLEGRIWGGVLDTDAGPAVVFGGADGERAAAPGTVALAADGDSWRLTGDGLELEVVPEAPVPESSDTAALCTVTGTISTGGAGAEGVLVNCPGTRSTEAGDPPLGSLRSVTGWFGPQLAVSLQALRAARSTGHQHDRIRATLFGAEGTRRVDEPRLSTTLRADDLPARTSLELWVGEGDDLYPRRAAGEARGPAVQVISTGLALTGVPLTCHASGLEGVGVYLLARFA